MKQKTKTLILTKLPASVLTLISYASIRGRDSEEGAIQRLLNPGRIASIKAFTLDTGDFPASIVLNWVNPRHSLVKNGAYVVIPPEPNSAQIIDGQHRVAGIKAAIQDDSHVGDLELPVAFYENLDTRECANIFLSINTEQKPVPRSLVFDLYGIASETLVDPAAVRARDIATSLNDTPNSPYYQLIKFPGSPRIRGGIALSTVVGAVKPLVEEKGVFDQVGFPELERQKLILFNFFEALRELYGQHWAEKSNAFLYAAGFTGAIDFLKNRLIPYCNTHQSFKKETILRALRLGPPSNLILQADVKGMGGKDAPKQIFQRLVDAFSPASAQPNQTAL
ncbi:MAG TPA: DGQHR domain-containing protein [Candidatus Binataceae bacterium]|nr:DGQHR domain-containing protein [Candidatus Binataceae bacterium]